jgi:NADH-quinone oxidoreductase subunit C
MNETLAALLRQRLGDKIARSCEDFGQLCVDVAAGDLFGVCETLRDDPDLRFNQLSDLCGVDYSAYGEVDWVTSAATGSGFSRGVSPGAYDEVDDGERGLAVVYHLLSSRRNERLRLRVFAYGEPPVVSSVVDVWASANWYEREAFDLFGILFDGHPDLRRILTDYGFEGHPFRKDFPLHGKVEVRYDPTEGRVIYQPVSIENRVLVPRVIRDDWPRAERNEPDA